MDTWALPQVGSPIRTSTGQSLFAALRGFSQLTTSFVGSWCLGIRPMLFIAWSKSWLINYIEFFFITCMILVSLKKITKCFWLTTRPLKSANAFAFTFVFDEIVVFSRESVYSLAILQFFSLHYFTSLCSFQGTCWKLDTLKLETGSYSVLYMMSIPNPASLF